MVVLFVVIDDHARIGFSEMYPDESKTSAEQSLCNADYKNGSVFRSKCFAQACAELNNKHRFAQACAELNNKHRFTRPYRPQTSGK